MSRLKKISMIFGFLNCVEYIFINIIVEVGFKRLYFVSRKKMNNYWELLDIK